MVKKLLLVFGVLVGVAGIAVVASPELRETVSTQLAFVKSSSVEAPEHEGSESHDDDGGEEEHEGHSERQHKIIATCPIAKDVKLTQQFVCQIHSRRHIDVKALEGGYLESIKVNEGQLVKKGEVMFHILPTIYAAKLDADLAEAKLAQVEFDNTRKLVQQNMVSDQELNLDRARLEKALAKVKLAKAEMDFADIKAPFDGIVDRLHEQEGSLIEEGAELTTMSDNSLMWVYFNVPEARYIEYQRALKDEGNEELDVELRLANHEIFDQKGKIGAIEADFDNRTGNIPFRADFPNPDRLLRHGQTGTILVNRIEKNAVVIPQRATYEILAKTYVYVVGEDDTVRQREIKIKNELEDIYVIAKGLEPGERIVLEGIRQVRDGDKIECEFAEPEEVLGHLKFHAE